ncbi:hypothetical protein GCM10015534_51610 [Streptomyces diastaticus subsp. diastaticus]|nr:hypothetical protein GCM10015534_51610 [Streptomyces diastaticus subsp. diastaticus]
MGCAPGWPGRVFDGGADPFPARARGWRAGVPWCAPPGEGVRPVRRFHGRGRGTPGPTGWRVFGCPWDVRYRHRPRVAYPSRPRCGVEKDTPDPREHIQDRLKGRRREH